MHNLDLHAKAVHQCKLGGDMDNEKKPVLNYVTMPFGFYLLQL